MASVKVTDGAITRFFDINNPHSKRLYNELMNNNTGYNTVVDKTGQVKEFTEQQVREQIEAARQASKKKERKATISAQRAVLDDDEAAATTPAGKTTVEE